MKYVDLLVVRYPILKQVRGEIENACAQLILSFANQNKLLVCGNGGSDADAQHIVGELMKSFCKKRELSDEMKNTLANLYQKEGELIACFLQESLPAIHLNANSALASAYINDVDATCLYAQQVYGYAVKGDVFLGISTSGNSLNIVNAMMVAKAKGAITIAFTGKTESRLSSIADICIKAPEVQTYKVQELHIPIYHAICLEVEEHFFQ